MQKKVHYKIDRVGKTWFFTALTTATLAGVVPLVGNRVYAATDATTVGTKPVQADAPVQAAAQPVQPKEAEQATKPTASTAEVNQAVPSTPTASQPANASATGQPKVATSEITPTQAPAPAPSPAQLTAAQPTSATPAGSAEKTATPASTTDSAQPLQKYLVQTTAVTTSEQTYQAQAEQYQRDLQAYQAKERAYQEAEQRYQAQKVEYQRDLQNYDAKIDYAKQHGEVDPTTLVNNFVMSHSPAAQGQIIYQGNGVLIKVVSEAIPNSNTNHQPTPHFQIVWTSGQLHDVNGYHDLIATIKFSNLNGYYLNSETGVRTPVVGAMETF
ncbi:hypothetical protein M8332_00620 [Fructilactobacillus ixorae]|uniref:Uncharacterized protein n=1 Tax=Fructilactobacillus ixorae TaxID=1750535 RepID=A0ABY5C7X0_9LACO|nr:hypothetical protein [Fructilactobacillus ixorae]USS93406.1 hypothetical protein M8332_00620 [Fructilactobacillus ixorae]